MPGEPPPAKTSSGETLLPVDIFPPDSVAIITDSHQVLERSPAAKLLYVEHSLWSDVIEARGNSDMLFILAAGGAELVKLTDLALCNGFSPPTIFGMLPPASEQLEQHRAGSIAKLWAFVRHNGPYGGGVYIGKYGRSPRTDGSTRQILFDPHTFPQSINLSWFDGAAYVPPSSGYNYVFGGAPVFPGSEGDPIRKYHHVRALMHNQGRSVIVYQRLSRPEPALEASHLNSVPHTTDEIRLQWQLLQSTRPPHLCCNPNGWNPPTEPYVAISHVWSSKELDIDDGYNAFMVTKCRAAVRTSEDVWMDFLCIDQRSASAIIDAVASMPDLYRRAAWVAVLLEEDEVGTIRQVLDNCRANPKPRQTRDIQAVRRALVDYMNSLLRLMAIPWFTRIWTLQEFTLNSDVVFLSCNEELVTNGILKSACNNLKMSHLVETISAFSHSITSYQSTFRAGSTEETDYGADPRLGSVISTISRLELSLGLTTPFTAGITINRLPLGDFEIRDEIILSSSIVGDVASVSNWFRETAEHKTVPQWFVAIMSGRECTYLQDIIYGTHGLVNWPDLHEFARLPAEEMERRILEVMMSKGWLPQVSSGPYGPTTHLNVPRIVKTEQGWKLNCYDVGSNSFVGLNNIRAWVSDGRDGLARDGEVWMEWKYRFFGREMQSGRYENAADVRDWVIRHFSDIRDGAVRVGRCLTESKRRIARVKAKGEDDGADRWNPFVVANRQWVVVGAGHMESDSTLVMRDVVHSGPNTEGLPEMIITVDPRRSDDVADFTSVKLVRLCCGSISPGVPLVELLPTLPHPTAPESTPKDDLALPQSIGYSPATMEKKSWQSVFLSIPAD
ncbi:hypothetical protein HK097_011352, partial [Rhizophlyctis rosea]